MIARSTFCPAGIVRTSVRVSLEAVTPLPNNLDKKFMTPSSRTAAQQGPIVTRCLESVAQSCFSNSVAFRRFPVVQAAEFRNNSALQNSHRHGKPINVCPAVCRKTFRRCHSERQGGGV